MKSPKFNCQLGHWADGDQAQPLINAGALSMNQDSKQNELDLRPQR